MGGGNNALSYGVGATEYAAAIQSGLSFVRVPEAIRFELVGELKDGCTAKDVILKILATHARDEDTLDRSMEFGGPGLASLSMDERATLCNMATECTAKTVIAEWDEKTIDWLKERRPDLDEDAIRAKCVLPDEGAHYDGGVHTIDLSTIEPMVAHQGNPDGIPWIRPMAPTSPISVTSKSTSLMAACTAGKIDDFAFYAWLFEKP